MSPRGLIWPMSMKFTKSSLIASLFIVLAIVMWVILSASRKADESEGKSTADIPSANARRPPANDADSPAGNTPAKTMPDGKIAVMTGDDWREFFAIGRSDRDLPSPSIQAEIIALADDLRTAESTTESFTNEDVAVYVEAIRVLLDEKEQYDLEAE